MLLCVVNCLYCLIRAFQLEAACIGLRNTLFVRHQPGICNGAVPRRALLFPQHRRPRRHCPLLPLPPPSEALPASRGRFRLSSRCHQASATLARRLNQLWGPSQALPVPIMSSISKEPGTAGYTASASNVHRRNRKVSIHVIRMLQLLRFACRIRQSQRRSPNSESAEDEIERSMHLCACCGGAAAV